MMVRHRMRLHQPPVIPTAWLQKAIAEYSAVCRCMWPIAHALSAVDVAPCCAAVQREMADGS
eukprot:653036-Amphidinium_carterae.1